MTRTVSIMTYILFAFVSRAASSLKFLSLTTYFPSTSTFVVGVTGHMPLCVDDYGEAVSIITVIEFFGAVCTFQISLKISFKLDIFDPAVDDIMPVLKIIKRYVFDHTTIFLIIIFFLSFLYF